MCWQVSLLKEELASHRESIRDLQLLVLEKDSIVQGLQNQVQSLLRHGTNTIQGCIGKDKQIEAQYLALENLKNLTGMQNTLSR